MCVVYVNKVDTISARKASESIYLSMRTSRSRTKTVFAASCVDACYYGEVYAGI